MSRELQEQIRENAAKVREMHERIHETFRVRDKSPAHRQVWSDACAVFHATYDALAYPGGYETALESIRSGDRDAIETALVFLELRPYFFRSGYMFKVLLRRVKHAPLSSEQAVRLEKIVRKLAAWRERKLALRRMQNGP